MSFEGKLINKPFQPEIVKQTKKTECLEVNSSQLEEATSRQTQTSIDEPPFVISFFFS